MKGFFKFLWRLLLILLISGVVLSGCYLLDWPLQWGVWALGVGFGLFFLILLGRRLYVRYRAKAQVKRVIHRGRVETEDAPELGMTPGELNKSLRKRWHQTIRALKKSQLKHRGDPLYVLPWYMIIGRPTAGKSSSLRSAQLLKPGIEHLTVHEDGSTLNLEWWLYEEAIVIDTAGRYAVPEQMERDRKEWNNLLELLSRHKQREPLNGLVVTVSAERLLSCDEEEILEEGRQVRTSINNLMDRLEVRVPVYLMITKCDLIEGFAEWISYLPDDSLLQAVGYLNEADTVDYNAVLDKALNTVLDRMKELRLLMMERTDTPDDSLLTLPTTMEGLRSNLHAFINTALVGNVYQEAPHFRGVYFSSSVQELNGKPTRRGVFLHEFFTRVLPFDRGLYESLPSIERIRRAARKYVLGVGGAVTFITFAVLTYFYDANRSMLEQINNAYQEVELTDLTTPGDKLLASAELMDFTLAMDQYKTGELIPWWLPYGGGNDIEALKAQYVTFFRQNVLQPIDEPIIQTIDELSNEETSVVAGGLIRRINALQSRLEPESEIEPKPIDASYLGTLVPGMGLDQSAVFYELYMTYLDWSSTTLSLNEERLALQNALLHLVNRNHGDYNWIIDWVNAQGFPSVRLEDFWGGSRRITDAPEIDPAFTLAGYEFVNEFMAEFSQADQGDDDLASIRSDFQTFYQREYRLAWETFAERFSDGTQRFRDRKEWITAMQRMATDDNPYFNFIERMYDELAPFEGLEYASSEYFGYFKELQGFTIDEAGAGRSPGASKVVKKALGKLGKVGKLAKKAIKIQKKTGIGESSEEENPLDTLLEMAVTSVDDYKAALAQVAFNAELRSQSLASLTTLFTQPESPQDGSGPTASAWTAVYGLQELFGRPDSNSALFWELYSGPIDVAYDFMMRESSCELQDRWENDVLAALEGVEQNKMGDLIVGEQGVLWTFLNSEAQPFVSRELNRGYVPVEVGDRALTFEEDFYDILNEARNGGIVVGNEFTVKVKTLPSGSNSGAAVSPYATFLNLHCSDGVQTLANYNYPTQHDFLWSLEQCGDTSLTIEIGQMRLTKEYPGVKGFPRFLSDFQDGRNIFTASDFPGHEAQLAQANVSQIDINYQIVGQRPVVQSLDTVPLSLPPVVASCWPEPEPDSGPQVSDAPTASMTVDLQ